jgi:hypothetical protein
VRYVWHQRRVYFFARGISLKLMLANKEALICDMQQ